MSSNSHSEREHAALGASSAKRWMKCPGSIAHLKRHPLPESEYAAEGTQAHECCEALIEGKDISGYPEEMQGYAQDYCDYCDAIPWAKVYQKLTEARVHISDSMYGTVDRLFHYDRTLHVIDFKYGQGLEVDPEENEQLMFYAVAALNEFDIWNKVDKVVLHVFQPRKGDEAGRSWETTTEELELFEGLLLMQEDFIVSNPDIRIPGDHCDFFCNRLKCAECTSQTMGEVECFPAVLETGIVPDVKEVTKDQIIAMVLNKKKIEGMLKDAEKLVHRLIEDGEECGGLKTVQKKATRKLKEGCDPAKLSRKIKVPIDELRKDPQPRSWTDIKKAIAKQIKDKKKKDLLLAELDDMYYHESSGTVVVPEGDKRPAVKKIETQFEPIEETKTEPNKTDWVDVDPFA